MELSADIQEFVLSHGLTLSFVLSCMQLLSWKLSPGIWTGEITDGKNNAFSREYIFFLILFFSVQTAILIWFDKELISLNLLVNQTTLFVLNMLMFAIYVLVDLIVIDFLLYIKVKPGFMKIKGVESNYSLFHHFKYAVRLFIFGGVFCFIASILATR